MQNQTEESKEEVNRKRWYVLREGSVEVVTFPNSSTVRFRVRIGDVGREPFISQWFNDIVPAEDFLDRVKSENEELVRKHLQEVGSGEPEPS